MQVTVTGGTGHPAASLTYSANDIAYVQATAFAATIDESYETAIYYNPNNIVRSPGYLIIPTQYATNTIQARGFGAVVDENNGAASTVIGGSAAAGQTVLAGDGGLNYAGTVGNNTVVAGGGDNRISFRGDTHSVAAYTGDGNDTIIGGNGFTTISAGNGDNRIHLYAGTSSVISSGVDTISIDSVGTDTISVQPGGKDDVLAPVGAGTRLTFIGGALASTVKAGAGSYTIFGNAGGGVFDGGSAGNNSIVGGSGSVTIVAGGAGDTLLGGSGDNSIRAGAGDETLGGIGTIGSNLFDLRVHSVGSGSLATDYIQNFITGSGAVSQDLLQVGGVSVINRVLSTYVVGPVLGNSSYTLPDGTKLVLEGYTTKLTIAEFKH